MGLVLTIYRFPPSFKRTPVLCTFTVNSQRGAACYGTPLGLVYVFIESDTASNLLRDVPAAKIHHNPNTILASRERLLIEQLAN